MDEQEMKKRMEDLLQQLDDLANNLQGMKTPLKLKNSDGSTNYHNVKKLLTDKDYSEWRVANPDAVSQAKTNLGIAKREQTLGAVEGIAGLGLAGAQIAQSAQEARKSTPPKFPTNLTPDRTLESILQKSQVYADQGLSPQERTQLETQIDRTYQSDVANAKIAAGGQASSFGNQAQIAASRRNSAYGDVASMAEEVRRGNRTRLSDVLRMKLGERQQLYDNRVRQFQYRDFPLFEQRQSAIQRLRDAGIRNAFGAGRSLIDNMVRANQLFYGDLPGTARVNADFDPSNPASAIFNSPLNQISYEVPQMASPTQSFMVDRSGDPNMYGPPQAMYYQLDQMPPMAPPVLDPLQSGRY